MTFMIQSLPKKSSQLINKGASALVKFFESDIPVLYLYGNTGTGKTYAVDMLVREFGYEVVKPTPPFTKDDIDMLCTKPFFVIDKKLVIVDGRGDIKANDVRLLSEGRWDETRLIIIGDSYPKTSPIRTHFKNTAFKFAAIKFYPFEVNDIVGCLSIYALELGVQVSYDVLVKIAKHADGDMRVARIALRCLVHSGDEDAVDVFLPVGESSYINNVAKMFSKKKSDIKEAIDFFSPYVSMLIIRENIIKFCLEEIDLFDLLHQYANLDVDNVDELVNLAYLVGLKIKTFKYAYYRKSKSLGVPEVDVDCSDIKKILYYQGVMKWKDV